MHKDAAAVNGDAAYVAVRDKAGNMHDNAESYACVIPVRNKAKKNTY